MVGEPLHLFFDMILRLLTVAPPLTRKPSPRCQWISASVFFVEFFFFLGHRLTLSIVDCRYAPTSVSVLLAVRSRNSASAANWLVLVR
jgi:hypothetical protein